MAARDAGMDNSTGQGETARERKRRETRQRIADAGMRLFVTHGYDSTTLDDIAREAGIARRTFFYYFRSKDEILLALQSQLGTMIVEAVAAEPEGKAPLATVRDALVRISAAIPADEMIAIDRVMRANAAVQARKQASYVEHERTLLTALRARWPDPERETGLRLVAMMAIGAVRLSTETLSRENGTQRLADILSETFDTFGSET